ncbi:MAG: hypothetical protein HON14_17745 [Rhodospirillaceae bacterium]|nr:hypothetical protein [Rhodospirillaceae bacterium]MBT4940987.1 hypothetical protein [Rhodospirillaceae bacterium]MBT5941438.1 hypothetical protein [Rhodospirillaceae bacterium]MBT7266827.1 hypothetical protein [Rhodospirillaceae bacterium]
MRLNQMFNTYKDQVEFLCIYTREAHPSDGWQVHDNLEEDIVFPDPTTDDERTAAASACQIKFDLQMPMLIDSMDNDVEEKYISLPMRLFVVDADGKIAYSGDRGPRGFDPDSWEAAIKALI